MIEAVVNYGEFACDPPENTWDVLVVIQMNMSSVQLQYSACVCMFISHAIENNLHKQQCIVGLARTCKYNALYIFCMFTSPHKCGLCTHHISSLTDPGLVGCSTKRSTFPPKEPPSRNFWLRACLFLTDLSTDTV